MCAWVQARAGEVDAALDSLEKSWPVWNLGRYSLALMPEWEFLRGHPRFDALATVEKDQAATGGGAE